MAKQDDFVRITLRLPPELHARLSAAALGNSLNAEIVARLEESFRIEAREAALMAVVDDLRASRIRLEVQAQQLVQLAERGWAERDDLLARLAERSPKRGKVT